MYRARLLVVVDDLQWAGAGSASALVTLSGRLATHRIGWLLALRRGELADAALDAAGRLEAAGASGIRLGPLGETAVAQVARDMLGGEPDEALREVLSRAEGQPFLLTELLRGLRMEDLAVVRLVIQGATDREAAQRLYISAHTVNSHLRHVFAKLGIRSRVELAHRAGQRQAAELPFRRSWSSTYLSRSTTKTTARVPP